MLQMDYIKTSLVLIASFAACRASSPSIDGAWQEAGADRRFEDSIGQDVNNTMEDRVPDLGATVDRPGDQIVVDTSPLISIEVAPEHPTRDVASDGGTSPADPDVLPMDVAGAEVFDASHDLSIDSRVDVARGDDATSCLSIPVSWIGVYRVERFVIHYRDPGPADISGRKITHTEMGTLDELGTLWGARGEVELKSNGDIRVDIEIFKNGLIYNYEKGTGLWSRQGDRLYADYLGDSGYRRTYSVSVNECLLKVIHIAPANFGFDTPGVWDREYSEIDLSRIR